MKKNRFQGARPFWHFFEVATLNHPATPFVCHFGPVLDHFRSFLAVLAFLAILAHFGIFGLFGTFLKWQP